MLVLLPALFLIAAALVVLALQLVRNGYGYAWLTAVGFATLTWIWVLVLRWHPPGSLLISGWLPGGLGKADLVFQIDLISWPYAFSLATLVLAVILTATARMQPKPAPWAWAGSLGIGGTGLLAVVAGNPLTICLAWTWLDIIEVLTMVGTLDQTKFTQEAVISFAARVSGTLLLLGAIILGGMQGQDLNLGNLSPLAGMLLLLAAALRLGVIPLHLPYREEVPLRRGLGTVLRLVSPASSLLLLSRLPGSVVPADWKGPLLWLLALAVLFGSVMWLSARDELAGRPYWIISLGGLVLACDIQGRSGLSLAWGVVMILSGGLIFLFSIRERAYLVLMALGLIGLSGLPFTLAASGWGGLVFLPYDGWDVILLITVSLLMVGYIRHSLAKVDIGVQQERWVQAVFPLGMLLLVAAEWIIEFVGWPGSLTLGTWWAGPAASMIAGLVLFGWRLIEHRPGAIESGPGWIQVGAQHMGRVLYAIFSLNWLYRFLGAIYRLVQRLVRFITIILEGEGGVLWTLLLLALLASLFRTGASK